MTKTQQLKVVPSQVDGIPVEVANEMLFSPKVKMVNRMRKRCMAAREKVYPSSAPIRKVLVPTGEHIDVKGESLPVHAEELQYLPNAQKSPTVKLAQRAAKLTFAQLLSHHKRADRRRARVQKDYLRLMQSDAPERTKRNAGAQLTALAEKFETAKDILATEIQIRRSCCK